MAGSVGAYYDKLHMINCLKEAGEKFDEEIAPLAGAIS
jgi:hypothetical protein